MSGSDGILGTTRRRRLAATAALVVPVLLYAAPFLFSDRCLAGGDFVSSERIHALWNREAFSRDRAPLFWASSTYGGAPEYGRFQGSEPWLYPPHWLWFLAPPEEANEILFTLHVLLAVVGMYRLGRRLGMGRAAAVLSGLAYGLAFMTTGRIWAGHYGVYVPVAQTPFLLVLLLSLIRTPTLRRAATLSAAGALALVSGQPVYLYHFALLALVFAGWSLRSVRAEGGPWKRSALAVGGSIAGALLLAAIYLLPAFENALNSTRPPGRDIYGGGPIPRHHVFVLENTIGFFIPYFGGSSEGARRIARDYWHEKAVYIGILPLMCAAAAMRSGRRGVGLLAGIGLVALMDAMARDLPLHSVLITVLPGYGGFRLPGRVTSLVVFSLSLLAGLGWEALRDRKVALKPLLLGSGGVLVAVAAVTVWKLGAPGAAAGLAVVGVLSAGVLLVLGRRPDLATVGALLLVPGTLLAYGIPRFPLVDRKELATEPWYASAIGADRGGYRVLNLLQSELPAAGLGFRVLRGYGYPVPAGLAAYYGRAWQEAPPLLPESLGVSEVLARPEILDRLNVKWIVSRRALAPGWLERARHGDEILFENPAAFGAAFLLEGGSFPVMRRSNRLQVTCTSERPGSLVVSESWMPGWKARVDGRPVPVQRYEDALLRVEVPAGSSTLDLDYSPATLAAGAWVSGLAAAALLAALGVQRFRRV